ncbi:MAG TPA: GNAT family N-acetyltransferase [Methylomirabilota bacterium]|nr:GNAT family N-acetyltransferase [Methylomirabilota bacterium]
MKIEVLHGWSPTVDSVLASLPDDPDWPHDLYRGLANLPNSGLRVVVAREGDQPVGLVAFQREGEHAWVPVTHWVLPGLVGYAAPGVLPRILQRVPFSARVGWWRMLEEPPRLEGQVRDVHAEPTLGTSLKEDFEGYWKKTGCLRDVRRGERGCAGFTFEVNAPGALEWIIANSERKWREAPDVETPRTQSHLFASSQAQRSGRYVALTYADRGRFVVGQSVLIHRGDLVCTSTYRDPEFDQAAPGNGILAKTFYWGREQGFTELDLGGGFDYKRRWVPVRATKAAIRVEPTLSYVGSRCVGAVRGVGGRALRAVRGVFAARNG